MLRLGVLILAFIIVGCDAVAPNAEVPSPELSVAWENGESGESNTLTIENRAGIPLRIRSCGGPVLQIDVLTPDGWTHYGGMNNPCLAIFAMTTETIPAGDKMLSPFAIYDVGIYRLVLDPENAKSVYSDPLKVN